MRRTIIVAACITLVVAACGSATTSPSPSPSSSPITIHVTFDGKDCAYDGPASVPEGAKLVFVLENTPAGVEASTAKGATTVGADLLVVEAVAGTTLESVMASLPAPVGTKGTWPTPEWAIERAAYAIGPKNNVMVTATGAAYYVGCHEYWGMAGGTTSAVYPATVIEVVKG